MHKRIIISLVSVVMFMEFLDTTIINTAIPTIAKSFNQDPLLLKFAVTSYFLSLAIFTPISAWVADKLVFAPQRKAAGIDRIPLWVEYTASFFPVIFAVFFLRSFLFEPFKIPSGSMIPTLMIGDFILVNKFIFF